jgi:hypothetical protein
LVNKWLFVSYDDWANAGYLYSKAVESAGEQSKAICLHKLEHTFPESSEFCDLGQYLDYANQSDVIVAMHSIYSPIPTKNKKLFVFHGGTIYRNYSSRINNHFNQIVDATIIQSYEFLDKGAKNQKWVLPPVDTKLIQPDYVYHDHTFAHYPSKPYVKGTKEILEVMSPEARYYNGGRFLYSHELKPWEAHLKRVNDCDIYIEQMIYGDWGIAALEAAALGKVVITNFTGLEEYNKEYGNCELVVANNKTELNYKINEILAWSKDELLEKKKATRKWVEDYHSLEAIGNRLKELV